MDTITLILDLMDKNKISAAELSREISLTNGLITQWKGRKQKPSTEAIIKLAKYFNVSTDYLLTGVVKQNDLLPDELTWLDLYHQIPDEEKNECTGFIKGFIAHGKK